MKRLLILGGTADARALAERAVEVFSDRLHVTTSWAGRTARHPDVAGAVRVGGFGGADGLADYLRAETVDLLIDATHPFAEAISAHASEAVRETGTPKLNLTRELWELPESESLHLVDDLSQAAVKVQKISKRAFLTSGKQTLEAFRSVQDVWFLVRLVDPPSDALPLHDYDVTTGRPPFDAAHERHLFETYDIDALVSKASGGPVPEKINVAQNLGCPIILITPPPMSSGPSTTSIDDAIAWIADRV